MLEDIWTRFVTLPRRPAASRKVLIVDDDPTMCAYVERVLKDGGFVTAVAYDGPEALATAVAEGPFDILLTDELMPQWKGHELVAKLRRLDPDVKVLYLTGYSDRLFEARGTLWAGEAYVDKPVTPLGLRQAIAMLVADPA